MWPREPHGAAASVTHAQPHTGAWPSPSASFIPPGVWAARDHAHSGTAGRCHGGVREGRPVRRPPRRVADRLRMREVCDAARVWVDTPALVPRHYGTRDPRGPALAACGAVSKGRGTLRQRVGCHAHEDCVLCSGTAERYTPPHHACSPYIARGSTAQQHSPPVIEPTKDRPGTRGG